MRAVSPALLVVVASLVFPISASAVPIAVPPDLDPGEQYRLAFVTSTTRDATSSDIADYNAFVTTAANSVSELLALGTTWTAIGSTATVDARDNTGTNPSTDGVGVPIFLLNGSPLASSNADLWDGTIDNWLEIDETGGVQEGSVLTGTDPDGTGVFSPGTAVLGASAYVGVGFTSGTSGWVFATIDFQPASGPLFALSGTLTVIPEPSTALLLGGGLLALGAARRRR